MSDPAQVPGADVYNTPLTAIFGKGDRQPGIYTSVIIPFIAAILCVFFRFVARRMNKAPLWWDDWLMIPALLGSLVTFGVSIMGLVHGNGKYIGVVTFGKLRETLIVIFIAELVYVFIIASVKFSILALYLRIFPQRSVKIFAWVVGSIIAGWAIGCITTICLQCTPTRGFWDKTVEADCPVNLKQFLIATAFINVSTDIVMLILPMILCLRLHQTRVNRLLLVGVFATGSLVTIISIVRLVFTFQMNITDPMAALNLTWSFVDVSVWTEVEQNIAIISGCLPCLKPIFSKLIPTSLVPTSLRRKSPTPGNSSNRQRSDLAGSRSTWMKGGSWRTRSRGYNDTELLQTENHDTDSVMPLEPINDKHELSMTSVSEASGARILRHKGSELDLESGTSQEDERTDSFPAAVKSDHKVRQWRAHG